MFDTNTDASEFQKVKEIGVGGFGTVLHLTHIPTGLQLAGKMINPKLLTEQAKEALKHEIDLMKQLNSPYTIRYYGTINYEGNLMILMDFCDLGSIRDLMDYRDEVLTEEQIAFVLRDTLEALDLFHTKHQMIHRDIKAGNILFNSKCEVKITDFGVSRQFEPDAKTMSTTSCLGTPFWMAPEVIRGAKSSFPADIWSVGATAIEMAEGGPPYCEFPAARAMVEISEHGFMGFRNDGYFSAAFADFVFKCMEMDPNKRPTASALLRHPFILQTKRLNHQEVFGDLPQTEIDFAKLLEMGEEEEDVQEFEIPDAPEEIPMPPPEPEAPAEEKKEGLQQLPKPTIKKASGKTVVKVTKRVVGYTTKFCRPVAPGVDPSQVYKDRAAMVFKDSPKAPETTSAPAQEQQPQAQPQVQAQPQGQAQQQQIVELIKKNPLLVAVVVIFLIFGFKKGLVVAALLFGVYVFALNNKKEKKD